MAVISTPGKPPMQEPAAKPTPGMRRGGPGESEAIPQRKPASNPMDFAIDTVFKSIAKAYDICMWMLGLKDESKTIEERARLSALRAVTFGGLLLLFGGGGAGYYLYRKADRDRRAVTNASNKALAEKLGTKVVTLDASASSISFDPASRPFRVVMIEKEQVKVAMIEVLNLKDRKVVEVKQLATGAVLLAQYLPADRQMEVGVLNGLESVRYLGGWAFAKTEQEVKILIHEAPPEPVAPPIPTTAALSPTAQSPAVLFPPASPPAKQPPPSKAAEIAAEVAAELQTTEQTASVILTLPPRETPAKDEPAVPTTVPKAS